MGGKESKSSFLSYDEAVKRVKDAELERLKSAFKRASSSPTMMTKNAFIMEVLGDWTPQKLAEQIYLACGGTSRGIAFKDVVCGLVLITCGSIEEKTKFIFSIVSTDGSTVCREDVENFYNVCETAPIDDDVLCIFETSERLEYPAFCQWMRSNADFCALTRWLLLEQQAHHGVKLSSQDDTPSFHQSLATLTKLSEKDIIELEKRYWILKGASLSGKYDYETFQRHISPPIPAALCQGLFDAFDKTGDGHIDFKEFICGICLCSRGSLKDRVSFCYDVFDNKGKGCLSKQDLIVMAKSLLEINRYANHMEQDLLNEDDIIHDAQVNNATTRAGFEQWASKHKLLLELLFVMSQVCHLMFGLRPIMREEEGSLMRAWMSRDSQIGLLPGHLYYIIAMQWWTTYTEFVHYKPKKTQSLSSFHTNDVNNTMMHLSNGVKHSSSANNIASSDEPKGKSKLGNSKSYNVVSNGNASTEQCPTFPGAVDNSSLVMQSEAKALPSLTGEGGRLKQSVMLVEGRDFKVVSSTVWEALCMWYGFNIALPRRVIVSSAYDTEPILELYPNVVTLYRHAPPPAKSHGFSLSSFGINSLLPLVGGGGNNSSSNSNSSSNASQQPVVVPPRRVAMHTSAFSKKNTVKQMQEFLCSRLKIKLEDMRLWDMSDENTPLLIEEDDKSMEDLGMADGHSILIEIRNRDMSWPEEMNSLVATKNFRERSNTGPLEKGATGMHNLGNTCFMNSAVQCVSNTQPLTQYFLSKMYFYELNRANPLGMKGMLAKRYGDLLLDLWSGVYRSIAPVKLRLTIGRYAPRFTGFQQHDSQELLSFLLDGLHEDLNRVHDKPYVELKDSDGRPDGEVAKEAWENHIKRNQSIIVDLFQGQLKSQVRCLQCGNCSVRFDPYTFLSLPLPMENSLHMEIQVFRLDGSIPVKYGLLLDNDAKCKSLLKELSRLSSIPSDRILLAEVVGASVRGLPGENQKVRSLLGGCLFAYEVPAPLTPLPRSPCSPSPMSVSAGMTSTEELTITRYNEKEQQAMTSPQNTFFRGAATPGDDVTPPTGYARPISPARKPRSPRKFKTKLPFRRHQEKRNSDPQAGQVNLAVPTQATPSDSSSPAHSRSASTGSSASCQVDLALDVRCGYVFAMHRKMLQMDAYFLSWQKFKPSLFGLPLVLPTPDGITHRVLYESTWRLVARFVSPGGQLDDSQNKSIYPFQLRLVQKDGQFCAVCPWYSFCRGCLLKCNDTEFMFTNCHVAIDWNSTTLHLQYQPAQERAFIEDQSVELSRRALCEPIDLNQCLKDFTKEEELGEEETWYCSKCKEHQAIAKKFDLWSLPPVLVIHLKRFQLVNTQWVKSNKIVKFPVTSFDPGFYLVKGSESARDKEELQRDVDSVGYRLCAVSCHSGLLNGGHYITYARNPNGKWYCYNDSSCKEVHESAVDGDSPYMLFYERKELNVLDYLPDVRDKTADMTFEDDDFESEVIKKYCVIQ